MEFGIKVLREKCTAIPSKESLLPLLDLMCIPWHGTLKNQSLLPTSLTYLWFGFYKYLFSLILPYRGAIRKI